MLMQNENSGLYIIVLRMPNETKRIINVVFAKGHDDGGHERS